MSYQDVDDLDYQQLKKHVEAHQLYIKVPRKAADIAFRLAWEAGHAYGNHEVANLYIDYAELANTVVTEIEKELANG